LKRGAVFSAHGEAGAGEGGVGTGEGGGGGGRGGGGDEAETQRAGFAGGEITGGVGGAARGVEGFAGGGEQGAAGGTQGDAARGPNEQRDAEFGFEAADLGTERRLGDVEAAGGLGKVERLGDGHEVAQVAKLHGGHTGRVWRRKESCISRGGAGAIK